MGIGSSRRIHPAQPGTSRSSYVETCAQCGVNGQQRKVASWWCQDCRYYICNYCAWNHSNMADTQNHYLIKTTSIPRPISTKPAWEERGESTTPISSKQALLAEYFDARADLHYVDLYNHNQWDQTEGEEHSRGEWLFPVQTGLFCCPKRLVTQAAAIITACTFLPGGYIAVADYLNEQVKLFDSKFHCNSYITLKGHNRPRDLCSHGSLIFVAIENKRTIEKLTLSLPYLCFGRKLKHQKSIQADGYCDSVGICRQTYFSYGLIVGLTFTQGYATKQFQVHIIDFQGAILLKLYYDDTGQTLFHGKVFVSGTIVKGEIIVSDKADGSVQGFDTISGIGTFKHKVKDPLGISVDRDNNIYVITNSCFYWISPQRDKIVAFLKRGHRSKSSNCCYDDKTKMLAVTSSHSETVQLYTII